MGPIHIAGARAAGSAVDAFLSLYPRALWTALLGGRPSSISAECRAATTSGRPTTPVGWQSLHTGAPTSAAGNTSTQAAKDTQVATQISLPRPANINGRSYQPPLLADGSRLADPGEQRYSAPYWIPEDVRKQHGLLPVLFSDPWNSPADPRLRRRHARLCVDYMRRAGTPVTAQQLFDGINADSMAAGGGPVFGTSAYVQMLMENLRRNRLVFGKKNPSSKLGHGRPDHPRIYTLLPYQQPKMGPPQQIAQEEQALRQKRILHALKRVKRGKSPFLIHRPRALFSILQHAQAEEQLRKCGL